MLSPFCGSAAAVAALVGCHTGRCSTGDTGGRRGRQAAPARAAAGRARTLPMSAGTRIWGHSRRRHRAGASASCSKPFVLPFCSGRGGEQGSGPREGTGVLFRQPEGAAITSPHLRCRLPGVTNPTLHPGRLSALLWAASRKVCLGLLRWSRSAVPAVWSVAVWCVGAVRCPTGPAIAQSRSPARSPSQCAGEQGPVHLFEVSAVIQQRRNGAEAQERRELQVCRSRLDTTLFGNDGRQRARLAHRALQSLNICPPSSSEGQQQPPHTCGRGHPTAACGGVMRLHVSQTVAATASTSGRQASGHGLAAAPPARARQQAPGAPAAALVQAGHHGGAMRRMHGPRRPQGTPSTPAAAAATRSTPLPPALPRRPAAAPAAAARPAAASLRGDQRGA